MLENNPDGFNWDDFLSDVKNHTDELSFDTWIKQIKFHKVDGSVLFLYAPSIFIKNWVLSNFKEIFLNVLIIVL